MNTNIQYDAQKKSGFAAAIMNALIPGVGYFYCGNPLLGTLVLIIGGGFIILSFGVGWFIVAPIVFIDGFLAAGRANKKIAASLHASEAASSAPKASFESGSTASPPLASFGQDPTPVEQAPQPANQESPKGSEMFPGREFIAAKCEASVGKNEYDFISVETGKVILRIREGEIGKTSKKARMGTMAVLSKFDVMLMLPNGSHLLRVAGGGMGGHSEVYDSSGQKCGEIKRTSKANLNFEAFGEDGALLALKAKGLGALASSFEIRKSKDGEKFGMLKDISKRHAKKILGENKMRMLDSNYDYAFSITIEEALDDKAKAFLMAANYQLAHVMGRI